MPSKQQQADVEIHEDQLLNLLVNRLDEEFLSTSPTTLKSTQRTSTRFLSTQPPTEPQSRRYTTLGTSQSKLVDITVISKLFTVTRI